MNLLDLFEALKPSDVPTFMRHNRLTMKDIEAERPQGAFLFRVVSANPNESPREFMSQAAAEEHARAVGGRVEKIMREDDQQIMEQDIDVPSAMSAYNRGALILTALQKDYEFARMSNRPIRINMGGQQFVISDPDVKNMLLKMAITYKKKGVLPQFLLNLGQSDSLRYLLTDLESRPTQKTPELNESKIPKKKVGLRERDESSKDLTPRAQRFMQQVRMRQPQARNDIEALIYDYNKQQHQDRRDIERLEKETNDLESDIRQDLEKAVGSLKGRKGISQSFLDQLKKSDQEQDSAIQRIMQLDRDQQKAIDDLDKVVAKSSAKVPYVPSVAPPPAVTPSPTATTQTSTAATAQTPTRTTGPDQTTIQKDLFGKNVVAFPGGRKVSPDEVSSLDKPTDDDLDHTAANDEKIQDFFPKQKVANMKEDPSQSFAVKIARHGPNEEPVR